MSVNLILSAPSPVSGAQAGQLSAYNGDEQRHGSTEENQLGTTGFESSRVSIFDGDALVNADSVIENFKKLAGLRLRGSSSYSYELIFRRFANAVDLQKYTKQALAGKKGKELLLMYLLGEKVPVPSRRTVRAALQSVWTEGLNLPFPVKRRELGELPEVGRRQSPRDSDVRPWIQALEHEEDPYLKTLVLCIVQLGIRPSHATLFRWAHVRYGQDGKPEAVITTGREPGNKHMTPVKARLPPDLVDALMELKKLVPDTLPEDAILPYHRRNGQLIRSPMAPEQYTYQWERFREKHLLNHLRPCDLRHWVSTVCRRAGLSYAAPNALQGHRFSSQNMRERYDNPPDDELLEEQATTLPYGPVGFVCPKIEVDQALPNELTHALTKCLRGDMLPSQFAEIITAYLTRQLKKPVDAMVA